MRATAIGAACARWWCSSRAAVRICAITAASAASGPAKAIWRVLFNRDSGQRHAMRWYTQMGRRVWPYEILEVLRDRRLKWGPTVREFSGAPQDAEEQSMSAAKPERRVGVREAA